MARSTVQHQAIPISGHSRIAAAEVWMRQAPMKKGVIAPSAVAARSSASRLEAPGSRAVTVTSVRARRQHSIARALTAGQADTAMQ